MTEQLELFTPPVDPPPARFDADQTLRGLARNTQGTCCGHWRAEHEYGGGPCRFCGPHGGCQQFDDTPVEPPCCRTSPTGHCAHGRHDQCPYSPGGGCYGGIIRTEYVWLPPAVGWPGTNPTPDLHAGNTILADAAVYGRCDVVELIEPRHRIVCGCDCHDSTAPAAEVDRCVHCPHTRADHSEKWCNAAAHRKVGDTTRVGQCPCTGFTPKECP